jgi:O-antigen/teichoic acid export membrane protein
MRLSVGAGAVFGTRTLNLVLTAATTFVLARLLGPQSMGGYYLLILIPPTMLALLSFGLPAAITYHTGRGDDLDEIRTLTLILALGMSAVVAGLLLLLQPLLLGTVLAAAPPDLFPIVVFAIPGVFLVSLCNAVTLGRQRIRRYNVLQATQAIFLFSGQLLVVGTMHAGLEGAIRTYVVVMTVVAVASAATMIRLAPFRIGARLATARQLIRFGFVLQPAALAGFFNYRADVYLMSILLRDPGALGVYGLAVNIAELCFYIPDAVSTVFFPRVAASSGAESSAFVPVVTRTVLMLTTAAAVVMGCAVVVGIPLVLPAFELSVLPALILLPGIIGLSASKVLSAYMTGSGRPGFVSAVSVGALVLNVGLNLALIPALGPAGAATASLISYSVHGTLMLNVAARQAGVRVRDLSIPRRADLALVFRTVTTPLRVRSSR